MAAIFIFNLSILQEGELSSSELTGVLSKRERERKRLHSFFGAAVLYGSLFSSQLRVFALTSPLLFLPPSSRAQYSPIQACFSAALSMEILPLHFLFSCYESQLGLPIQRLRVLVFHIPSSCLADVKTTYSKFRFRLPNKADC